MDFSTIPAKALNYSTRLLLGQYLNPEQPLLSKNDVARDYGGLAEQMGFDCIEIRNFQRSDNPTVKILEAWTTQSDTTISQLIQYLENMGRYDVIQDLHPKFEKDATLYQQKIAKSNEECPLQVPEISSCRLPEPKLNDSGILTREDANTREYTIYDAFVCYADEDIQFVMDLARFLESEYIGFKLFIRSRDMLAGQSEYEISMQLIQERCKRVLIILSPDFLKCPACEVQSSFAAGLGIDEKCRKLIPIVYKPCEIPNILRFISKIDFTKPVGVQDWIWEKLISSLQDGPSSTFISFKKRNIPVCNYFSPIDSSLPDSGNPAITFPSSITYSTPGCSNSASTVVIQEGSSSELSASQSKMTTKPKSRLQNLRFWKPQRKINSLQTPEFSASSISSSNATSGFHSQASVDSTENTEHNRKIFSWNNAS